MAIGFLGLGGFVGILASMAALLAGFGILSSLAVLSGAGTLATLALVGAKARCQPSRSSG